MRAFSDMRALVWIGLVVVAGCGKKPESDPHTGSGSGSGSGGGSSEHGSTGPAELGNDPTMALVKQAFGGKLPPFPLLAKAGGMAAVGVATPIGSSDVSTYTIAFLSGWTGSADAWGSTAQPVPLFDPTMAKMLLDSEMGEPAPKPDTATLAARAAAITKRFSDEGYTKFDGPSAKLSVGETVVGPAKVRITRDQEGGLAIEVVGPNSVLPPHPVKPFAMGHVADVDCVSQPVPRMAWFDTARKALLIEIGWNAGPDMCNAPDPEMGLLALP